MEAVLLVIHLIIALGIIILVLVQPAESGGFLGSGGSMSNMLAPRRKGDVLTRTTAILATAFFCTSLLLAVIASHQPHRERPSILDADAVKEEAQMEAVISDEAPENAATTPAADAPVANVTADDAAAPEAPAPEAAAPEAAEDKTPEAPIAP